MCVGKDLIWAHFKNHDFLIYKHSLRGKLGEQSVDENSLVASIREEVHIGKMRHGRAS